MIGENSFYLLFHSSIYKFCDILPLLNVTNNKIILVVCAGLSLSPDGNYVLSNSMDNTARIWVRELSSSPIILTVCGQIHRFLTVLRIRDVYPGSRILIFTHPGSRIPDLGSRIPDPKTGRKERGEKNFFVQHFL
jgi:hypothetical protein